MEKERKNHKQEYFRKLRENAFLLEEIAELKKELKEAKKYRLPSREGSLAYGSKRNSSLASTAGSRSMSSTESSSSSGSGSPLAEQQNQWTLATVPNSIQGW